MSLCLAQAGTLRSGFKTTLPLLALSRHFTALFSNTTAKQPPPKVPALYAGNCIFCHWARSTALFEPVKAPPTFLPIVQQNNPAQFAGQSHLHGHFLDPAGINPKGRAFVCQSCISSLDANPPKCPATALANGIRTLRCLSVFSEPEQAMLGLSRTIKSALLLKGPSSHPDGR